MIKTTKTEKILLALLSVLCALLTISLVLRALDNTPNASPLKPPSEAVSNTDVELGQHILHSMAVVRSPLSPVERQFTAQLLVGIANSIFAPNELEYKKNWITLLSIESKFNNEAKSPVGAIGLGQIMPQFAKGFGKYCEIPNITEKDVENVLVNATLSACLFKHLIENVPGRSVTLALSAYNSGIYSNTTKSLQQLANINVETASYISKFHYLREKMDTELKQNPK